MKDLYLRTTNIQALKLFLCENGIDLESEYLQNNQFILEWIGKVPKTKNPETGEVLTWFTGQRFNVRLIDENCTLFDGFTNLNPETPYRTFS
ncbi:hypothetical protein [Pedobacter duraquae]|uniref:Uncharacterized protein n=1 Tax=Pedobacter duraquae TaxID=425511 RepID=A0A4R6IIT3_9SPHI|nr:hypothetical protein [Pedobacter duraquae]TDO21890.1 hypothetical protein CLV32_2998 [Pedobacter duraquae]